MITLITPTVTHKILTVSSPSFEQFDYIPAKYTCDGINVNPEIIIENIPQETQSLSIIVDDPDGQIGTWIHWLAWNIAPSCNIKEHTQVANQGLNDFGLYKYCGPCPPFGTHRYFFKIYALDAKLNLSNNTNKHQLEKAIKPHIIA